MLKGRTGFTELVVKRFVMTSRICCQADGGRPGRRSLTHSDGYDTARTPSMYGQKHRECAAAV